MGNTEEQTSKILNYWDSMLNNPFDTYKELIQNENKFLLENIERDSIILDIGFGSGRHLKLLSNKIKEGYGIDKSVNAVTNFKKINSLGNIEVYAEDAVKTHFADGFFDFIICTGFTFGTFAEDKLNILNEMKRILRSKGKIILSAYSENALEERIKEYTRVGIRIKKIIGGTVYTSEGLITDQFTKQELMNLAKKAGLKIEIKKLSEIAYICVLTK